MLHKKTIFCIFLMVLLISACSDAAPATPTTAPMTTPTVAPTTAPAAIAPQTLTVFAAASLTESFTDIGSQFETAHPGAKVTFNFAGSQQLAQQIAQGAPVDVFASASQKPLDDVVKADRIMANTAQVFARNRLVVVYPASNPAGLQTLSDLARPGLRLVLAAREVPVGQYALMFLDKASQQPDFGANFKDKVLANVMSYEENVKFVFSKVSLGEADAGIVYTTDITPDSAALVGRLDIPDALNVIAAYPIAALSDSPHPELAAAFIDYVLSPEGQAILNKAGFISPKP
jgi:molybdate transport system substrate-binding protein